MATISRTGRCHILGGKGSEAIAARSWFYHVANVVDNPQDLRGIAATLQEILAESTRQGQKPYSDGGGQFQYKTLSASKFPCSCEYLFAEYNKPSHKINKYCVPQTAGST